MPDLGGQETQIHPMKNLLNQGDLRQGRELGDWLLQRLGICV